MKKRPFNVEAAKRQRGELTIDKCYANHGPHAYRITKLDQNSVWYIHANDNPETVRPTKQARSTFEKWAFFRVQRSLDAHGRLITRNAWVDVEFALPDTDVPVLTRRATSRDGVNHYEVLTIADSRHGFVYWINKSGGYEQRILPTPEHCGYPITHWQRIN